MPMMTLKPSRIYHNVGNHTYELFYAIIPRQVTVKVQGEWTQPKWKKAGHLIRHCIAGRAVAYYEVGEFMQWKMEARG